MTIIASMIESIRKAASYNRHELAAPRVILWPDEVIPALFKYLHLRLCWFKLQRFFGGKSPKRF